MNKLFTWLLVKGISPEDTDVSMDRLHSAVMDRRIADKFTPNWLVDCQVYPYQTVSDFFVFSARM